MYKSFIILFLICLFNPSAWAQPYAEGKRTRHRFAQLNLGLEQRFFSSQGTQSMHMNDFGQPIQFELNKLTETRLIVGGTHFWGHADFYLSIPLLAFGGSGFKTGVETGAKYFPYAIKHQRIRPFVGLAWLPYSYKQGEGAAFWRSGIPLQTGVVFNKAQHLVEIGFAYNPRNRFHYFIDKNNTSEVSIQSLSWNITYKMMLDATLSAEADWKSGRTNRITQLLDSLNRLNGFTLAMGPSSAFFLKPSSHINTKAPYAGDHKSANVFLEFGLGYYLHKPDLQFNLAYRDIKSSIKAFDYSNSIERKALSLEVYKFIADYHGFVPFLGIAGSVEYLSYNEINAQQHSGKHETQFRPGITFGWDIRPNRIQSWYLRTNLRYFPFLNIETEDKKYIYLNQLELNFIQLVVFPERFF